MEMLTSEANVRAWLGDNTGTSDSALIVRLIQQASRFILNHTDRTSFFKFTNSEQRDGLGGNSMVFSVFPVRDVTSVIVDNNTIPAAPALPQGGSGYRYEQWDGRPPGGAQQISIIGGFFTRGSLNVQLDYTSGFYISGEAGLIPATPGPYTVTVAQPHGPWGRDDGVTKGGIAMTRISTGTPIAGQYKADTGGIYTFAAADQGQAVIISYSYIPADIEQACIEIVAERYRYMKRIGQQSNSTAGQVTTSFSLKGLQEYVAMTLNEYKTRFQC